MFQIARYEICITPVHILTTRVVFLPPAVQTSEPNGKKWALPSNINEKSLNLCLVAALYKLIDLCVLLWTWYQTLIDTYQSSYRDHLCLRKQGKSILQNNVSACLIMVCWLLCSNFTAACQTLCHSLQHTVQKWDAQGSTVLWSQQMESEVP